jgi:hypothetical protein
MHLINLVVARPLATTWPLAQPLAITQPLARHLATTWPLAQPLATTWPQAQPLDTAWPLAQSLVTTWPLARPLAKTWPLARPLATTWPLTKPLATTWPLVWPLVRPLATTWPAFGHNVLAELIMAFNHNELLKLINHVAQTICHKIQTQLIVKLSPATNSDGMRVQEVGYCYSKIFLHFCKSYRTFCEGVKEQIINSNTIIEQQLIQMFDVNHNGLVDFIGHNGLVNFIGLSIAGVIGLGLVSLIGQISLIDSLATSNHWPIGHIGVIGFGLIALSASSALLAYWSCNFAAATR